jgi:DNA-binding NarL/FixJ family response regulator
LSSTTVLLAGPNAIFLEGLKLIIKQRCQLLVSSCAVERIQMNLPTLIDVASRHLPATVILDARSDSREADNMCSSFTKFAPGVRVIALTSDETSVISSPSEWLRLLPATAAVNEFVQAILDGAIVDASVPGRAVRAQARRENGRKRDNQGGTLTPRRIQIVRMLAAGMSVKKIAEALGISARTAEYHKYRMMRALNISTAAGLVCFAVEAGLVARRMPERQLQTRTAGAAASTLATAS